MANNVPNIPNYVDEQDYEYILGSYLGNVRQDVDKREGSLIWDAGAPCCVEIAKAYLYLQAMALNFFASTATSPFLEYRCEEKGIYKEVATKARRLGEFTKGDNTPYPIPMGSRFSTIGETTPIYYKVISVFKEDDVVVPGSYILECETEGAIGNEYFGELLPITTFDDLATATLRDILIPGEEEEDIEDLRARYFKEINSKAFGGNITDYRQFIEKINGVGTCQIYPVWNGGGTVKISFIDSNYNVPSQTLVETVQNEIDPHYEDEYAGKGIGHAPIGHVVTVVPATAKTINVSADVVIESGLVIQTVKDRVTANLQNFFLEQRKKWDSATELNEYNLTLISLAGVQSVIFNTDGVLDVSNCTLNGSSANIVLSQTKDLQELPILGEVTLIE